MVASVNEHLKSDLFAYFQSHFKVFYPICWRQYPISNTDIKRNVYSNLWHCDSGKTSIITAFILLADVTENNGPTNIISKQDTKKALSMGYINRDNYGKSKNFFKNEADIFKCTGKAGITFVSRGPGATNASIAIHSAHQGGIPMILFIGQVNRKSIGKKIIKILKLPANQIFFHSKLPAKLTTIIGKIITPIIPPSVATDKAFPLSFPKYLAMVVPPA